MVFMRAGCTSEEGRGNYSISISEDELSHAKNNLIDPRYNYNKDDLIFDDKDRPIGFGVTKITKFSEIERRYFPHVSLPVSETKEAHFILGESHIPRLEKEGMLVSNLNGSTVILSLDKN